MSYRQGRLDPSMETNNIMDANETPNATPAGAVARYIELQQLVAKMAPDFEKFYKDGNKAAGTRVRNAMQELKTFAQMIRTEVQSKKNEGKPGETA
jgi:hypothetical protein